MFVAVPGPGGRLAGAGRVGNAGDGAGQNEAHSFVSPASVAARQQCEPGTPGLNHGSQGGSPGQQPFKAQPNATIWLL